MALNGMDEYKGSHVSVGISVLSGPNDTKLSWPPGGQFTVTLLNQVKNNNHHFIVLNVNSNFNTESSFLTVRYVCKGFISHADLFARTFIRKYHNQYVYMQVQYLDKK